MSAAMATEVVVPVIVDWTSASASRFLSTMSQLSQHAMRHFRRAAFRGGRGKLVAAKQLNGNAAPGGKGSYQQWRQLTEEAEGPAQSVTLRFSYAPSLPPFAAAPFLTGQRLRVTAGRDLRDLTVDALLRPLLLMSLHRPPCFSAIPLVQSSAVQALAEAVKASNLVGENRQPSASTTASSTSSHPVARYAALAAERPQLPHSRRDSEEAVIQRLRTAFTEWMHLFAPAASCARTTESPERLRTALIQFAALDL
mmetsp:Transcript_10426/g.31405  ORF Transcript_10426/g.31405 Transcript_10426/m.31405 type:complete len:254 (+) Transcript_10426:307-1068(+)|eukprot:CAMPEP_0206135110 /NCGR_PEP_ID=MMETSP1473-20131121/471_1 /ASSEMBLY_ACC=CAM_ASM_001109 /TAXON_ID=1461547 /ORGANISM="Stichococcus sp, Strain RCC1054" /LENGTH=253 /DNA_ID=CAMNT_0053526847 /DNA_START=255 /DNA_END=1016 /DNA_ORIENTATION=+